MLNKPYAESCAENQQVILEQLKKLFIEPGRVLEVGSGTGQHAVYFSERLPHLTWQPSDQAEYLPGIQLWLDEASLPNVEMPLLLDVNQTQWPVQQADYAFSANTAHIMSWKSVQTMFIGLGEVLLQDGLFVLYGPFNYNGQFTSDSNARFDQWLKQRDPLSGIRDFEALEKLAHEVGMQLREDIEMPVNNRVLVWQKG